MVYADKLSADKLSADKFSLVIGLVVIVVLGMAAGVGACAPPAMTEAPDAGSSDVPDDVAFSQVANIVRNECAKPGCHGPNTGKKDLLVEGGQMATDEQIRKALDGTTVKGGDEKFIVPGDPGDSVLFQALNGSDGRTQMPLGQMLDPRRIETIRRWIAQGAKYE